MKDVFEVSGKNTRKGPLVVLIDVSGSMDEKCKDIALRALLLMLAFRIGYKPIHVIFIGSYHGKGKLTELEFQPGTKTSEEDLSRIIETISSSGYGTDIEPPIQRAMSIIRKSKRSAEMLLLSDGLIDIEQELRDEILEFKKKRNVKFFTVLFGEPFEHDLWELFDSVRTFTE